MSSNSNVDYARSSPTLPEVCLTRWEDEGGQPCQKSVAPTKFHSTISNNYRLKKLRKQHEAIERQLAEDRSGLKYCATRLRHVKKQKLRLKDEIYRLQRSVSNV